MQKDGNDETKGAVSGALLGGLMAGPFGALWGAQIGGVMGANNRAKRVQADELAAMGLSEDTMRLARQTAAEIEAAESSLAIVKRADNSQRDLIARLDGEMEQSYVAAEAALRGGDELKARGHLEARQEAKVRLAAAQADLPAAVERVRSMEASLAALAERARRVEEQISRSVVANRALRDDAILGSAELPPPEDPLEKRFRDLDKK